MTAQSAPKKIARTGPQGHAFPEQAGVLRACEYVNLPFQL